MPRHRKHDSVAVDENNIQLKDIWRKLMTLATDLTQIKTALGISASGTSTPPTSDTAVLAQILAGVNTILAGAAGTSSGSGVSTPPTTAPTVTSISPASGPAAGGTAFTLNGTNFNNTSAVNFTAAGGSPVSATSVAVVNSTTITAVSPVVAPGVYDVIVVTPLGTSATSAADQFTAS